MTAVCVVGDHSVAEELTRHLPAGWSVRSAATIDRAAGADAIVLVQPTTVRVQRAGTAGSPVVAVVDRADPPGRLLALLEAGADACVRAGRWALLGELVRGYASTARVAPVAV